MTTALSHLLGWTFCADLDLYCYNMALNGIFLGQFFSKFHFPAISKPNLNPECAIEIKPQSRYLCVYFRSGLLRDSSVRSLFALFTLEPVLPSKTIKD